MISDRIRAMRGAHWLLLFGLIFLSWCLLFAMSLPADLRAASRVYGSDFIDALCNVTLDGAGYLRVLLMWCLMSGAMMAPTALPAFATYDDLSHSVENTKFSHLVLGYLLVWFGFSILASALQFALFWGGFLSSLGDSRSALLSAGLLILAGGYQFSPLKEACLSKCRMPMTFFMQYFEEGAFRNGLRLGVACLGCCWALMLLGFVGGVMNLAFMGLATLIMIFEKLPDIGRYVTRPLGAGLFALAVYVIVNGI